ncbi:5'/3'-nucleotidase SurE [Streptomyces sp. PTD9-10]|uniref:5'/3'-nucleotidase SurE n=1 Tax=Streptomyces sp. PTD9-10 TaxID=3120151 RepID=UPI003FCECC16
MATAQSLRSLHRVRHPRARPGRLGGTNFGPNVGATATRSGTVAAAMTAVGAGGPRSRSARVGSDRPSPPGSSTPCARPSTSGQARRPVAWPGTRLTPPAGGNGPQYGRLDSRLMDRRPCRGRCG